MKCILIPVLCTGFNASILKIRDILQNMDSGFLSGKFLFLSFNKNQLPEHFLNSKQYNLLHRVTEMQLWYLRCLWNQAGGGGRLLHR